MEVQRDMAGAQCDVARSSCSFLGSFGAFEVEPRRVGGSTRHGGGLMRRGALVLLLFGQFWRLGGGATSCWRPNATWWGPMRRGALFWLTFRQFCRLGGGATSCWRPNATWLTPNTTWRGPSQSCTAFFWALQHIKSHLRTKSEVAGFMLIWFLVCLTCQLGH